MITDTLLANQAIAFQKAYDKTRAFVIKARRSDGPDDYTALSRLERKSCEAMEKLLTTARRMKR
jgi:hypothetical protein